MSAREVELAGGAPWGFRLHGGADQRQPLRISRVNPGRKASLSGIREGDVISSINGRTTRGMSNADAHAALRQAGPLLRLGLNQDKDLSPRRRSIGKATDLKRPSQLLAEVSGATQQAPVYATIRQAPSPRPPAAAASPSSRASMSSLPAALGPALGPAPLVQDEPPKIHPTNPFYTTLPANSSASRLPVPHGRPSFSNVDRTKKDNHADYSELKSPSFFTKTYDTSSLPYLHHNENGIESGAKSTVDEATDPFSYAKFNHYDNRRLPNNLNEKNPFETKRNSDPFEKYLRQDHLNGKSEFGSNMPGSQSENNFNRREEITKTSTITEHKINEVEEVRTIKKIVLNGCGEPHDTKQSSRTISSPNTNGAHQFDTYKSNEDSRAYSDSGRSNFDFPHSKQHQYNMSRSPNQREEYHSSSLDRREETRLYSNPTSPLQNHFTSPPPASPCGAAPPAPPPSSSISKPPAPVRPEPTAPAHTPSPTKPHICKTTWDKILGKLKLELKYKNTCDPSIKIDFAEDFCPIIKIVDPTFDSFPHHNPTSYFNLDSLFDLPPYYP